MSRVVPRVELGPLSMSLITTPRPKGGGKGGAAGRGANRNGRSEREAARTADRENEPQRNETTAGARENQSVDFEEQVKRQRIWDELVLNARDKLKIPSILAMEYVERVTLLTRPYTPRVLLEIVQGGFWTRQLTEPRINIERGEDGPDGVTRDEPLSGRGSPGGEAPATPGGESVGRESSRVSEDVAMPPPTADGDWRTEHEAFGGDEFLGVADPGRPGVAEWASAAYWSPRVEPGMGAEVLQGL